MKWEIIVLILLVISLGITMGFIIANIKRNNLNKENKSAKAHIATETLKSKFSVNSEIGEMIDTIQLWELTNSGEVPTKEQEEAEAEAYSNYLKSDMCIKLNRFMEGHDGSGS
ncbi:MAG: hypothetical protein NC033_05005 [Clostridiales bacterium]|nr:hypothetical protein [Clostridiales bacterium]